MIKNFLSGLVASLVVVLAAVIVLQFSSSKPVGSDSGSFHSNLQQFEGGGVNGGYISYYATTTAPNALNTTSTPTSTLSAYDLCNASEIQILLAASTTVSIPSSTYIFGNCLNYPGDSKTLRLSNMATTTSNPVIGFAAGDSSTTIKVSIGSSTSFLSTSSLGVADFDTLTMVRSVSGTVFSPTGTMVFSGYPWLDLLFSKYK